MIKLSRYASLALFALAVAPATAAAQADTTWFKWVGCYSVSAQDSSGTLRSRGTYVLDTLPAPGQRGRRLNGVIIGGAPQYRTAWRVIPGDTLDVVSIWVDGGFQLTLTAAIGDTLRGTFGAVGLESRDHTRRPALATRLRSCPPLESGGFVDGQIYGWHLVRR
jgi:hypothetical protein